jgi:O-antigen ligase
VLAPLPAGPLIAAFLGLVALQLVPLPPAVLERVSPGTYRFHLQRQIVPLTEWRAVSVSPADTFFGLVYAVGGLGLAYVAFREIADGRARRAVLRTVLFVGGAMTLIALVQAAQGTKLIYGFWRAREPEAVFGPYLVRSHFGGYMVMAAAVGLGFAAESLAALRLAWGRRRVGWLALGDPAGTAFARTAAYAMVPVVGLLASGSRGALLGLAAALFAMALVSRRLSAVVLILVVTAAGVSWIGVDGMVEAFETRGLESSRLGLWRDALRLFPDFPVLGFGFNAFGMAYLPYQTFWRYYFYQSSHNEYLDVLLGTGALGFLLFAAGFARVLHVAWTRAGRSALDTGLLGALMGLAAHNLVDFNWQIQASAATYAVLLGLAIQPVRGQRDPLDPGSRNP